MAEICEDADESPSFQVALETARECIERAKGLVKRTCWQKKKNCC